MVTSPNDQLMNPMNTRPSDAQFFMTGVDLDSFPQAIKPTPQKRQDSVPENKFIKNPVISNQKAVINDNRYHAPSNAKTNKKIHQFEKRNGADDDEKVFALPEINQNI